MKNYFNFFFFAFLISFSSVYAGDNQPPDIELQDVSNNQRVYTDKIYIAGQVNDANAIETLTLNNTSILESPGQSIFFSHLAKLSDGKNIITIKASDEAGNRAIKEITLIKENLPLSQLPKAVIDKRMRIAVYPFEQNGTVSEDSGLFMDLLTMALQNQNRFQLTDRALMDRILEEQKLSLSKLIDKDAAVKIGRIISAQAIITGSIIETRDGIEMVGRMIDTETSEIIATEKIHSMSRGFEALNFLAESMAVQFHNDFPMVRGVVIKRKDGHIFTDLGRNTIPLRGRLIIYRENDPETFNTILGYARIIQVLPDMSKAELISGKLDEIREMDWVILQ
jgi:TolB-like protein